jgi:hypothetical protein
VVTPPSGGSGAADPIKKATDSVTSGLADVTDTVTQPVVDTLSLAAATTLCSSQLGSISDPLNLLKSTATTLCAQKVEGKTEDQALAIIPNTLSGVLAWLGL